MIKDRAFHCCSGLTTAILNDGLEEIGEGAFLRCRSLVRINIPPSVREIDEMAFEDCSNLTTVQICDEIEEFVSGESMRRWWNNGVHEKCLSTYFSFVPGAFGIFGQLMAKIHHGGGGMPDQHSRNA